MKAIFRYGEFKAVKQIQRADQYYYLPKPMTIAQLVGEGNPSDTVQMEKLTFILKKPPMPGELVEYEFIH